MNIGLWNTECQPASHLYKKNVNFWLLLETPDPHPFHPPPPNSERKNAKDDNDDWNNNYDDNGSNSDDNDGKSDQKTFNIMTVE